eukprot:10314333-Heterocapsa_arctica.AAC.1
MCGRSDGVGERRAEAHGGRRRHVPRCGLLREGEGDAWLGRRECCVLCDDPRPDGRPVLEGDQAGVLGCIQGTPEHLGDVSVVVVRAEETGKEVERREVAGEDVLDGGWALCVGPDSPPVLCLGAVEVDACEEGRRGGEEVDG